MADAALISGLINGLLSNLAPLIKDEFSLVWNFKKEVDKLSKTLSTIDAVLEDAERKRDKDKQTEVWLQKLKDVLYKVRDIVDECSFEDLRLQVKRLNASSSSTRKKVTNFITHPFSIAKTCLKIAHKIKDIREKIDQISSDHQKLHLCESNRDSKINELTNNGNWRETISLSNKQVYGRDKEKKYIIDILLNNTSSVNELSVLPIVGMGGLGKTTLAQMVFNDGKVAHHFDPKIWVCVSDEFDIKLIIKAILKEEKAGDLLQELQENVRNKLRGKRYLIILDDVWNENVPEWDQLRSILDCGSDGAFILTTTRKKNVAKIMETTKHVELSPLLTDDCWLLFKERAFVNRKPKPPHFINIGKEIAIKCKGVPLVAKTLGSQLRFTSDENEWCKIRDSGVWEISKKENSILSVLKLSYYDLPYVLRRCFVFCAIFPKDTKIEKERLIQFWMAHDLILTEDYGNQIWNEFCWRSIFQDEKESNLDDRADTTCMMHDLMHDLALSVMQNECYTMNAKRLSDGLGQEIRHVTVIVDEFDKTNYCSIKKMGGLQSIMLDNGKDDDDYRKVGKEILSDLKELSSLRVLEVRRCVQYEDLCYVGCLKHLRYLDLSYSKITRLSNSICDLLNLQTLKLNGCSKLEILPRNTSDLINLRHLYLEDCDELKYMPRGMRQLKHLKTLSVFVIGGEIDHCQLDELKELGIGGSLTIKNLGRVSDECISRGVSMAKMSNINKLTLSWKFEDEVSDDETKRTRHDIISEALEIPTSRLKILEMTDYRGVNPPKWVGMSSSSPTGHKNNDNDMVVLFPLLEKLLICRMKNLRELVSPTIPSPGAFTNLSKIEIYYCPNLKALPAHLKALKVVTVWGECSEELLYSISNLSALTNLHLQAMNKISVLFPSSSTHADNNEAQLGVHSTFQSLKYLTIKNCKNLRRLFDDEGIIMPKTLKISGGCSDQQKHHHLLQGQTERTRLMISLTQLTICDCPGLKISLGDIRRLNINNSLRRFVIKNCPNFKCSEEWSYFLAINSILPSF